VFATAPADAKAVKAAVDKTVATFGRLDVLVNNAGTAIPKTFEETTLKEMDRVIDINIRGVFAATQTALKHMKDGGRVITIGPAVGERAASPWLVRVTTAPRVFCQRTLTFSG
jgi:3-oxoacyl-[acyl-carrier protein] reductase